MKGLLSRLSRRFAGQPEVPVDAAVAESVASSTQLLGQALQLHRAGQLIDAQSTYERVLVADPSNFDALHMLGVLAHQTGRPDLAIELIGRAVDVQPNDASAITNLGLVYRQIGRLDQAEGALRRAVQLNPAADHARASLGVVLRDRGNLLDAEGEFTAAIKLNPNNDEAQSNLASILRETHRYQDAESHFRSALALRPDRAEYWSNLAGLQIDRGAWTDAESCLRAVIERGVTTAETLSHLGFVLLQLNRMDEAEVACRDALATRADYPDALVNLASVLKVLGDLEGAEESCRRALAIDAAHVAALVNLGTIRKERGDAPSGEELCRRAMALDPRSSAARFNLSTMLLMRGEYAEGFALSEDRFGTFRSYFRRPHMERLLQDDTRRWRGAPVTGRRVVIWAEQGHGDNLMMLRYLPLLKQHGASHVTFVCDTELLRIAGSVDGVDAVVTGDSFDAAHDYDLHCPTMSLPLCFQTSLAWVPAHSTYIAVPGSLSVEWSDRLAHVARPRVGLVWAGNQNLREYAKRSMSLEAMSPLQRVEGVQFFSLQKGDSADQADYWNGVLINHMEACRDFMDTAALIDNLDLVISIDTAVAHLAGAMGKPVWLLNRAESDWRWGLAGEHTAWYPSMRIFRQQQPLDWAPVMQNVADALAEFTALR